MIGWYDMAVPVEASLAEAVPERANRRRNRDGEQKKRKPSQRPKRPPAKRNSHRDAAPCSLKSNELHQRRPFEAASSFFRPGPLYQTPLRCGERDGKCQRTAQTSANQRHAEHSAGADHSALSVSRYPTGCVCGQEPSTSRRCLFGERGQGPADFEIGLVPVEFDEEQVFAAGDREKTRSRSGSTGGA